MSKYIDAEKLKAELNRRILQEQGFEDGDAEYGYKCALKDIKRFIISIEQEQPEVNLEKVWDWIDETFTEREIDSRYGEAIDVVMSDFDVCKSDLRKKYELDFGLNARKEE